VHGIHDLLPQPIAGLLLVLVALALGRVVAHVLSLRGLAQLPEAH